MVGLKKASDFRAIYRRRDSRANDLLVFYKMKNHLHENRIGISVSKKVGNSVVRHRLKRQVREICRLHSDCFLDGFDIIIVLRAKANGASYADLCKSVEKLALRHKIWKEEVCS